jgi:hypothetical protein
VGGAALDDLALVQDVDAVGHLTHHGEVVRDEQVADPELHLQGAEQVQDLGLHRHVERRHRLVADKQLRLNGQGTGDRNTLAFAARQRRAFVSRRGLPVSRYSSSRLAGIFDAGEPQRFVPIYVYTAKAGKKEHTRWIYGLELPSPKAVSWITGQLIFWSNDLLCDLAGEGFEDTWHAAEFLYYAKDLTSSPAVEFLYYAKDLTSSPAVTGPD